MARTGENDTLFAFGSVVGKCYGHLVLRGGRVLGYDNPRERRYRLTRKRVEFSDEAGNVTSVLERMRDKSQLVYTGRTAQGSSLYLWARLSLAQTSGPDAAPVIVNTLPKAGTYWMRAAFVQVGYRPTDIHLNSRSFDDNRGMGDDPRIHQNPRSRRTDLDVGALGPLLPRGTVTVGHLQNPETVARLRDAGVAVVNVIRDEAEVLESAFWFDLSMALQDRHAWQNEPTAAGQFRAWQESGQHLQNLRDRRSAMLQLPDAPLLDHRDLASLDEPAVAALDRELGVAGMGRRLATALQITRNAPTSTLSVRQRDPEVGEIARRVVAEQ